MLKRRQFQPGDPVTDFTADDYNAIGRELERLASLSVSGQLELLRGSTGRTMSRIGPEAFYAELSGSSSPYSYTEKIPQAGGAWAAGNRTGTSNAYEVNGKGWLSGQIVLLRPGAWNDWRFQWVGGATQTCAGVTRICLSVTSDGCGNTPAYGATVTATDAGGSTVGTCTTEGTVLSLALGASGSGYTNGTGYSLGLTGGGGSGATGTFDVVSGHISNVVLTSGGTGYTSAPTVSFPGAGSGSGASATANMGATCCISVPSSGTYTLTTSIPGATPVTTTVHAACIQDTAASVAFPASTIGTVCFSFTHCGYANGGDTIVISKAGTPVATITTDGSGNACTRLGTGDYTWVLTTPRGSTKNGSFSVFACSTTNVNAGDSATVFCVSARTDAPAGCTAAFTVVNQDTGTSIGNGSFTTIQPFGPDVPVYIGETCITVTEYILGQVLNLQVSFSFTNFSRVQSYIPANFSCYGPSAPFTIDFGGFGPPC